MQAPLWKFRTIGLQSGEQSADALAWESKNLVKDLHELMGGTREIDVQLICSVMDRIEHSLSNLGNM